MFWGLSEKSPKYRKNKSKWSKTKRFSTCLFLFRGTFSLRCRTMPQVFSLLRANATIAIVRLQQGKSSKTPIALDVNEHTFLPEFFSGYKCLLPSCHVQRLLWSRLSNLQKQNSNEFAGCFLPSCILALMCADTIVRRDAGSVPKTQP